MLWRPRISTHPNPLFPYPTLFRSQRVGEADDDRRIPFDREFGRERAVGGGSRRAAERPPAPFPQGLDPEAGSFADRLDRDWHDVHCRPVAGPRFAERTAAGARQRDHPPAFGRSAGRREGDKGFLRLYSWWVSD